ncbi:Spy/CpxP family protein refolding chaperone [Telluria aromaticivorans]|uniref:Spy/CpxP family protein refolding chaperone n=1 Tax=Telluria aromaticivorans TaxID=2725995 RepID=A0A7Y2JZS8_9BURK|nr:Spy/CpxP family protein refolding chaperone [Telluria aromaticivorans]NNG23975.1 Spy/CpxP family protein refolding chaperone [Telluria aromaticivorans]
MKTIGKNIVIVLAALGIAGASIGVQAQTQAPHDGRHAHAVSKDERQAKRAEFRKLSPEQRQARMAEFKAKRLEHRAARQAKLHEALKLTPAQQPVWQAFVASMTPPQQGDRAAQRLTKEQRLEEKQRLTAPQRLERRIAMQKQRTARMEARLSALNSLYSALTPEQRKVFDEQKQGRRGGRHHGGDGGHGMMRG